MDYALSAVGQGVSAYIAMSAAPSNSSSIEWEIGGTFVIPELPTGTNLIHLMGGSGTTQNGLRVNSAGSLIVRQAANNRIVTATGLIEAGVPFSWRVVNNVTTGNWELYVHDLVNIATNDVGSSAVYARGTNSWGAMNQFGRFSTTTITPIEVRKFYSLNQSTFADSWDETTATGTGTEWTSTGGTRTLTIMNATGAANSWWIGYGGVEPITYLIEVASTQSVANSSSVVNVSAIQNAVVGQSQTVEDASAVLIKTVSFILPVTAEQISQAAVVNISSIQRAELINSQTVENSLNVSIAALMQSVVVQAQQLTQAQPVNIESVGGAIVITVGATQQLSTASIVDISQTQVATIASSFTVEEAAIVSATQLQIVSLVGTQTAVQASPVTILDVGAVVISVAVTESKQEVPTLVNVSSLSNVSVSSTQTNVNANAPITITQDAPAAVIISVVNTQAVQQAAIVNARSTQRIQVMATQTRTYGGTIEEDTTKVIEYWRINVKLMQAPFAVKNSTIVYQALR